MMKPSNCFILLALLVFFSCRQTSKTEIQETSYWNHAFIDSSFSLLNKNKDTTKPLLYFDSAFKQLGNKSVYAKASRFALKANYFYFFKQDNLATVRMIDSAIDLYSTAGLQNHYPRTCVGLLLFGGHIAYQMNQYSKANQYYFKAKELGDAQLTPCERTAFNYNIAMVLFRQQNYRASLDYFKEAYRLQESCAPQTAAVVLQQQEIQDNIGLCLVKLKNNDSALMHFDKALDIANSYKDSLGPVSMAKISGVVYGNKAKIFMDKNLLDDAEKLSLLAIALNDRPGYETAFAQTIKLQLADIYSREKNLDLMFKVLENAKEQVENIPEQRLEWERLMASYFEKSKRPDSAVAHLKNYLSLSDSIATEQKQLTAADFTQQLKEKEQEQQITKLRKGEKVALTSLWVTLTLSVMAVMIIYLLYQNYRRSKKNLTVLQRLNEEINTQKAAREEEAKQRHKLITKAVIKAQENERSLIGLELHDNINQVLTTVKLHNEMVLEGVGDPKIILPRTMKYLQDCINEIRSLSKRLSAPTLGKISLEESVTDLIASVNATSKIKITHQICGFKSQVLKKELHLGLYRILQEQLHNILKHADASEVCVNLEKNKDSIRLLVSDNGKGFAVKNSKSGIGLVNMQTRAESLNGTFELESFPGGGCKVKVTLPCFE